MTSSPGGGGEPWEYRAGVGVQGRPAPPGSSAGTRVPHLVRFPDVVFLLSGIPRVPRTSPARGQVSVF